MWQQTLVGSLVLLASGYVAWTFLPMRSRQSLLDALAAHGLLVRWAARHRARLTAPGCSNCPAAGERRDHAPDS